MGLMTAGGGLSNSKLEQATAIEKNVLSGKTFYAGNKVLKTGTMPNRGIEQIGGGFAQDSNYFYIQPIPEGYYYNDNPVNASWNPRVKIEKQHVWNQLGGHRDAQTWATSVAAAGDTLYIRIPHGVYVESASPGCPEILVSRAASFKTGTVSCSFAGNDWAQTQTMNCSGTVIGITDVRGTGNTYAPNTIAFSNCPEGRGVRFRISGTQIIATADNLVSTNTIWIDYVYI